MRQRSALRAAHRLLFQQNGAVTIFAVMVLSLLLLFAAVLIDYARIAMLNKMTEDAARAGARSVLAAYDESLYARYGLFGRGGTSSDSIFKQVTASNLELQSNAGDGEFMRLVSPSLQEAHVDAAEMLGNHNVLHRQVLEEMKYKAPVDFTLELAGKFTPFAAVMKEAAVTVNLLEQLNKLYEKRQEQLDRVLGIQLAAAKALSDSDIGNLIPSSINGLEDGGDDTAIGLAADYADYAEWVLEDEALSEQGQDPEHEKKISKYRKSAASLLNKLKPDSQDVMEEHTKLQGEALSALTEAEQLNERMRTIYEQAKQSENASGFDKAETGTAAGQIQTSIPSATASELQQIQAMGEEVIYPAAWFTEYRSELTDQSSVYASLDMEIGGFSSNLTYALDNPDRKNETLREGALNMRVAYEQYAASYIRSGSKLDERKKGVSQDGVSEELKQQKAQISSLWKQTRSFLHTLTALPQSEEHNEVFQEVQGLYKQNLLFNQIAEEAEDSLEQPDDADEGADASYSLLNDMFGSVGDMLSKARDDVYFSEYAAERFTYFAPQNLKAAVTNGDVSELTQGVALGNQELEYIVYGFHDPVANLAASYGELFAARYAIRTMEGLSACKASGHPLLVLSCSLIYGLEKTSEDMVSFTETGAAPLSKYADVDVTYLDYLRLFLLLHGADSDKKLARMSALIEHNTGAKLTQVPASITGEVTAAADLWFLPGAMKLLGKAGILDGQTDGGQYEVTRTIGYSY